MSRHDRHLRKKRDARDPFFSFRRRAMNPYTAQYMNERQSALRGVKNGWYAIDALGSPAFGPFSNRETCLTRIARLAAWSKSSALRHRPA
jgi:hypothetical protein